MLAHSLAHFLRSAISSRMGRLVLDLPSGPTTAAGDCGSARWGPL